MKHKKLFQALAVIPLTLSLAASGCSLLPKEAQDEIHKQLGAIQDEVDQQTEALQSQADKVVSQVQEVLPNPDQFQPRWDKTCTGSNSAFYGIGNQFGFAFIRPDGTVASEGFLDGVSSEMDTWSDVKQLALQHDGCATFGLLSDGTVSITGELYSESLKKVENWTDVERLYPYRISRLDAIYGMVGLSKKGELLFPYESEEEISALSWSNIQMFDTNLLQFAVTRDGKALFDADFEKFDDAKRTKALPEIKKIFVLPTDLRYHVLLENGTVKLPYDFSNRTNMDEEWRKELTDFKESIENWTNINDIYTTWPDSLIGIGNDHTVRFAGYYLDWYVISTSEWTDIQQFIGGRSDCFFGIKNDGSVVYAYQDKEDSDLGSILKPIDSWENIIAIDYSQNHFVGLKIDGTVVATGDNSYGKCDVSEWTDIISIVAGPTYTAGLRSNGEVVYCGRLTSPDED